MKKKNILATALITGTAAALGAVFYKIDKENKKFTKEKWDEDISKRYKMADDLIRSGNLLGALREDVINLLGINGLRSNTKEAIEYYLSIDTDCPKLLILEFDEEDKVTNCTACI